MVKKVIKRKVAKAVPKAHIQVTVRKKMLGEAPEEHSFMLQDGRKLKTVYHLIDELETMAEEDFQRYVNEFKNDFANWVRDVFDAKDLAEELQHIRGRIDTQRALLKHLVRELHKAAIKHQPKEECTICA